MERTRNVDFLLLNEDFEHLTLKCDLDLGVATQLLRSVCQVISKNVQGLKS
jgi:hypothetical protein